MPDRHSDQYNKEVKIQVQVSVKHLVITAGQFREKIGNPKGTCVGYNAATHL